MFLYKLLATEFGLEVLLQGPRAKVQFPAFLLSRLLLLEEFQSLLKWLVFIVNVTWEEGTATEILITLACWPDCEAFSLSLM